MVKDTAETRVTEDRRVTHQPLDIKALAETRVTEHNLSLFPIRLYRYQVGMDLKDSEETRVKRDHKDIQDSRGIRVTKVC